MRRPIWILALAALALASCGKSAESIAPGDTMTVAKADLHPCAVTGTPLTLEDCDAAGRWARATRPGQAAFNAPDVMRQGERRTLVLALGKGRPKPPPPAAPTAVEDGPAPAPDPADAAESPDTPEPATDGPPPPTPAQVVDPLEGTTVEYAPLVGSQMAADLVGPGFDIKPLSPRSQPVSETGVTTWEWEVTARQHGNLPLAIRTTVEMIDSQGKAVPLQPTTQYKVIKVRVGLPYLWELLKSLPDWIKAITSILVALAALFAAWRALRGGKPAKPEPPAP